MRIEDPMFSSVLFGAYFGILVWGDSICETSGSARSFHAETDHCDLAKECAMSFQAYLENVKAKTGKRRGLCQTGREESSRQAWR